MRSPVIQARMQADALRRILNAATRPRSTEASTVQGGTFDAVAFEVLVAISDKGVIERKCAVPEVFKADVIPDRARELVARRRTERGERGPVMDTAVRAQVADFLASRHTPLIPASTAAVKKAAAVTPPR